MARNDGEPRKRAKRSRMLSKIIYSLILCASCFGINCAAPLMNTGFKLRVLHTNDMHSRFQQITSSSGVCSSVDAKRGECYGGFPRIATLIREARKSDNSTLYFDAGDVYQGTSWFTVHKWKIATKLLNLLNPNAMCLGNHEFDEGIGGLIPFIKKVTFPIVTSNLDLTKELTLEQSPLMKSTVLDVMGHKIGVIGYLTPKTKSIAPTGNLIFLDEVTEVQREVEKLQNEGVKILIALGHSDFNIDKRIAEEVDGIDLVIGGHTNTFLYNGKQPDREIPAGPYPTEIIQKNGRKVYVVQAYAHTKYLGNLTIDFDSEGEVENILGNPILVDSSIAEAQDLLDVLENLRPAVEDLSRGIGSSRVLLDGTYESCHSRECNFGNLLTDAMIDYNVRKYTGTAEKWTDASIAISHSGGIRASIDVVPGVNITKNDILTALPFSNKIVKIEMPGKILLNTLEESVSSLQRVGETTLPFLQHSGIKVTYDLSKPRGSKIVSMLVRCSKCRVPEFHELDKNENYTVLANEFIWRGGDGHKMLIGLNGTTMDILPAALFVQYLSRNSPIYPKVEGRINFVTSEV